MVEFKLVISDPKTGKTMQKEVKDQAANAFLNKKIGEAITGEVIDLTGYEFMVTGGSDKSGFPMRKGISGMRKGVVAGKGSVGFRGKNRKKIVSGLIKKKTVCGETVNETISQINLKITKLGSTNIFEEKKEGEEKPAEAPKEEKKVEEKPKEGKPKKEKKPEAKPVEEKKEAPKKEEKPEAKPAEEKK